jgi:hypothetical protein
MPKETEVRLSNQAIQRQRTRRQESGKRLPYFSTNFREKKDGQYLSFIRQYTNVHGIPPAEHEMQEHFDVSPASVQQMVNLE